MLYRTIHLIFFVCLLSLSAFAQPYQHVTATSGTQTIGAITVTILPIGPASSTSVCNISPYFTHVVSGYRFSFSPPSVAAVRSHIMNINDSEIMTVSMNGASYSVTSSNLSNYAGSCSNVPPNTVIASNGYMLGTSNTTTGVQFDVNPGYAISSIQFYETNASVGGAVFDFYYLEACPYTAIALSDSPCIGSTLHLSASGVPGSNVTYSWSGPNSFNSTLQNPTIPNAQLSDTGSYYVTVTQDTCIYTASTHVLVVPLPLAPSLSASPNPLCQYTTLNLSSYSTSSGITYSWTGPNGFTSTLQNPSLSNISLADSGYYTGKVSIYNCAANNSIFVHVKPLPDSVFLLSNSPLCSGDTLMIHAGSSSPAATYNINGPPVFNSSFQNISIPNAQLSDTGNYYLSVALNGCYSYDTMTVVVKPTPAITLFSTNSPVCVDSSIQLMASSSTGGVIYQWTGPGAYYSTLQNSLIYPLSIYNNGYYKVKVSINGCSSSDSSMVIVNPLPAIPLASNNSPVCAGDTLKLLATDSTTGVSYNWSGPSNFTSALQYPFISNIILADSGLYTVTVTLNGCHSSDTTHVIVLPVTGPPLISILVSPSDTICAGDTVHFSAFVTNASSPAYQWRKNGLNIAGALGPFYTGAALHNLDIFSCMVTSNTLCQSVNASVSNTIKMHVDSLPPPIIYITSYPAIFGPGDTVTFTAHFLNGTAYNFQWQKNGINIPTALQSTYTSYGLTMGDSVCVIAYSGVLCTIPDSAIACMKINLGTENITSGTAGIHLYPNPNNGNFIISANIGPGKEVFINIINAIGQSVYQEHDLTTDYILNKHISTGPLAPGQYLLRLISDGQIDVLRFLLEK